MKGSQKVAYDPHDFILHKLVSLFANAILKFTAIFRGKCELLGNFACVGWLTNDNSPTMISDQNPDLLTHANLPATI